MSAAARCGVGDDFSAFAAYLEKMGDEEFEAAAKELDRLQVALERFKDLQQEPAPEPDSDSDAEDSPLFSPRK